MDQLNNQLAKVRSKLDKYPALAKAEVSQSQSSPVGSDSTVIYVLLEKKCSLHTKKTSEFARLTFKWNSWTGSNQDPQRIPRNLRIISPPRPYLFWNRGWIALLHCRLCLPRLQISPRHRTTSPRRWDPMAHLLGCLLLLLHDWSLYRFPLVLDPILLCLQARISFVGHVATNQGC